MNKQNLVKTIIIAMAFAGALILYSCKKETIEPYKPVRHFTYTWHCWDTTQVAKPKTNSYLFINNPQWVFYFPFNGIKQVGKNWVYNSTLHKGDVVQMLFNDQSSGSLVCDVKCDTIGNDYTFGGGIKQEFSFTVK